MTEKTNDESQKIETEAKWGVDKETNVEGPRYLWGSVSASLERMGRYLTQVVTEMVAAESNTVLQCGYYLCPVKKIRSWVRRVVWRPLQGFPFLNKECFFLARAKLQWLPRSQEFGKKKRGKVVGGEQ